MIRPVSLRSAARAIVTLFVVGREAHFNVPLEIAEREKRLAMEDYHKALSRFYAFIFDEMVPADLRDA